jgi:hypothetical protein
MTFDINSLTSRCALLSPESCTFQRCLIKDQLSTMYAYYTLSEWLFKSNIKSNQINFILALFSYIIYSENKFYSNEIMTSDLP